MELIGHHRVAGRGCRSLEEVWVEVEEFFGILVADNVECFAWETAKDSYRLGKLQGTCQEIQVMLGVEGLDT